MRTHLPIITPETASHLGYVAAIPIADLILYNIQKELIGACTSEDSIRSRALEVEVSWMSGALDVQFAGCFVAIRAEHEDEVWNDRDFKQWKGNMQRMCYGSNTTEDGISKMRACARSMDKGSEAEGVIGNVTESLSDTPTNESTDEDDKEETDHDDTHGDQGFQLAAEESDEEGLVQDLGSSSDEPEI